MNNKTKIMVFGEVLYDCFPGGEKVLGGAPFNVAWHLQALGDEPWFVSRIGTDDSGDSIVQAMQEWGLDDRGLQRDPVHPTGKVEIVMEGGEPQYTITPDVAYDFIETTALPPVPESFILYHGTLALRNEVTRAAWGALASRPGVARFVDVNLREPWWDATTVVADLQQARWAKLNVDELRALGFDQADIDQAMRELQTATGVEQVVMTRGKEGASVLCADGQIEHVPPAPLERRVDPVGAGDAFSAVYVHGQLAGWPVRTCVEQAQAFATRILSMRGATPRDRDLYADYR